MPRLRGPRLQGGHRRVLRREWKTEQPAPSRGHQPIGRSAQSGKGDARAPGGGVDRLTLCSWLRPRGVCPCRLPRRWATRGQRAGAHERFNFRAKRTATRTPLRRSRSHRSREERGQLLRQCRAAPTGEVEAVRGGSCPLGRRYGGSTRGRVTRLSHYGFRRGTQGGCVGYARAATARFAGTFTSVTG